MPISRRTFINTATSSLALAEAGLAQDTSRSNSPNDRIQLGCIGFGIMGQGDVRTATDLPGVQLVAVADVYDGRLTAARERYGDQVFTTRDHRELLARPNVDAVIVATPDHWHARIAADAMLAGKDVYCQKPMVQKVDDGHMVIDTQKKTGRILQVGSQRVSSIIYAKAKEIVHSGAIGEVHLVEAFLNRNSAQGAWQYSIPADASPQTIDWERFLGPAPQRPFEPIRLFRWRNYQDYGTGIPGDLFVHLITGIHFVMDSPGPQRICASGGTYFWKDGRDVPDLMLGMFDYAPSSALPGFQVTLNVNFEAGGTSETSAFRFIGTDGILNLSVGNSLVLSKRPRNTDPGNTAGTFSKAMAEKTLDAYHRAYQGPTEIQPTTEETFPFPRGYSEQVAHHKVFFDAVRHRKPVVEDAVFGLRAAGPALMSNASYFERRMVEWDPVNMRRKS